MNKLTYVDNVTVIPASNLNAIQDAIIDLEESSGSSVPTNVRQAIYTLLNSGAYATTGLTDEIAIVESWAEQVTALTISPTTLSLSNNTPQTITATVVPSGSTVSWSSSDTSVATVVGGVVTGVSNGSCTITASAGDLSATCAVTVSGFATLESISAVYTQSGTVYDTDSLDSLKSDLVVTATYDDTSTETVPSTDYVLSGTLEVGTSTITVVYSGKTTTFSVTVTSSHYYIGGYSLATPSGSSTLYIYKDTNNARSAGVSLVGEHPYPKNSGASALVGDYYPIPIPQGATSMIVTMPSALYVGVRTMHWNGSNYISDYSSSWTASSSSTFDVSSYNDGTYFAGFTFKVGTAGTTDMRNYDMSDVSISFE